MQSQLTAEQETSVVASHQIPGTGVWKEAEKKI